MRDTLSLHPTTRMLAGVLLAGVLLAGVLLGGCKALDPPEPPPRPSPLAPVWDTGELYGHLRFLNGDEVEGRATGTQGFARAAAYVAARMREFRLQPALGSEFRDVYYTPINYPTGLRLSQRGRDTLVFVPGVAALPEGRSDSGRVVLDRLVTWPQPRAGVLVAQARATTDHLRALRAAGAAAALVVGALDPVMAASPVEGLPVVQVTPAAAARLTGTTAAGLTAMLAEGSPGSWDLAPPLYLQVQTTRQAQGGALNVLGYVAGRHPALARELIVVCSDMDAAGPLAGVRVMDFEHFGLGTAALLEVARQYALFGRTSLVPERSLLFAVWSGGRLGQAGLRAFLQHPTWALDRIKAVLYVGLDPAAEEEVRALLAQHGLPLFAVPAPSRALFERPRLLMSGRRGTPGVDLSAVLEVAAVEARTLAVQAHDTLLGLAMSPFPVLADSLRVPEGARAGDGTP